MHQISAALQSLSLTELLYSIGHQDVADGQRVAERSGKSRGNAKLIRLFHHHVRHSCGVPRAHPGHDKMNLRASNLRLVNVDPFDTLPFQAAQFPPGR